MRSVRETNSSGRIDSFGVTGKSIFVRAGFTNQRPDRVLIKGMPRYSPTSSFEEQPEPELNSKAVDFRVASEFFRPTR